VLTHPLYHTTYEVTAIIEKEISEVEFELDKSKFLKVLEKK